MGEKLNFIIFLLDIIVRVVSTILMVTAALFGAVTWFLEYGYHTGRNWADSLMNNETDPGD